MSEISFNSPLLKELRMIALLRQALDAAAGDEQQDIEGYRWAQMRIHRITSMRMTELGASFKLNAEKAFLTMLRDEGRAAADNFLREHALVVRPG